MGRGAYEHDYTRLSLPELAADGNDATTLGFRFIVPRKAQQVNLSKD